MIDALKSFIAQKFSTLSDGTSLIYPRFFLKILEGQAFSVSHRFEAVGSDSSVSMYFENPSTSSRNVYVVAIEVVSTGQFWVDIYRENTISASGTQITPINLNFSSGNTSVVYVEYGGTYTLGTSVHKTVAPGGSGIRALGGIVEVGESVVIPPNNNFVVVATNKSASSEDMSIRIIWWEE